MSIINEALKKAQIQFERREHRKIPGEKEERNSWLWATAVLVLIGFLGCGLAFVYITYIKRPPLKLASVAENDQTKAPPRLKQAPPAKSLDTAPPTPKTSDSPKKLTLTGIVAMDGDYHALINNKFLKEGEYIEGMRVISISENKVEIDNKGQIITLTTR